MRYVKRPPPNSDAVRDPQSDSKTAADAAGRMAPEKPCPQPEIPAAEDSHSRACPATSMPQLKAVCADEAEILALAVIRFIASGAMTSDAACWDAAFDHADAHLGHHQGAAFVGAMASLMRAVRIERTETWRFLPATCCRVTEDEMDLVALISAARGRRFDELWSIARLITSAHHPVRLMESARQAATAIEVARGGLAPARSAPPLSGTVH